MLLSIPLLVLSSYTISVVWAPQPVVYTMEDTMEGKKGVKTVFSKQ